MNHVKLTSQQGYLIPCTYDIQPNNTVIICHGFGSSKKSQTVLALQDELYNCNIGSVSFDFPQHGDSTVNGDRLRLKNCLNDLKTVEEYILQLSPHTNISYFASSFGAYTLLIYLATYPHAGKAAFLRSCACNMHTILMGFLEELTFPIISSDYDHNKDRIIMSEVYERDFFITNEFIEDLSSYNIFDFYPIPSHRFHMIHGEKDSVAPIEDAIQFSKLSNIPLTILPNAEHRLLERNQLELVVTSAVNFFKDN